MSDPRIYHRVGPVAPEGRQIYDDIRRRDLGLTSAFNSELSSVNGEITTLEDQVNALAVTPVSVGVASGESSTVAIPDTDPGPAITISLLTVTPVVAKPFIIKIQCLLSSPNKSTTLTVALTEGESTIATLLSGYTVLDFSAMSIPITRDVLVANSDTTVRTFDLTAVHTSVGILDCDYDGTTQAFQWTVA